MPKPIAIAAFLTASAIAVAPMMQDHSGHRNWASMPEDPAAVDEAPSAAAEDAAVQSEKE